MKEIDRYETNAYEIFEKLLTNLNVNIAMIRDQWMELTKSHEEFSKTHEVLTKKFSEQQKIMGENITALSVEAKNIKEEMKQLLSKV